MDFEGDDQIWITHHFPVLKIEPGLDQRDCFHIIFQSTSSFPTCSRKGLLSAFCTQAAAPRFPSLSSCSHLSVSMPSQTHHQTASAPVCQVRITLYIHQLSFRSLLLPSVSLRNFPGL